MSTRSDDFEVLDYDGLDEGRMEWLVNQHDRLEICLLWIQRLIVDNHKAKVIDIDPPIQRLDADNC